MAGADLLALDATHAIRVAETGEGHRAEPVVLVDGAWRRAGAGDGAAVALVRRLYDAAAPAGALPGHRTPDAARPGADRGRARDGRRPDPRVLGRRRTGRREVDDRSRWSARTRQRTACAASRRPGSRSPPPSWGLVEWRGTDADEWVPVAVVQAFLPNTEDGWTWAVSEARRALHLEPGPADDFARDLGGVVGRMHLALADDPPARLTPALARQHADEAIDALDRAVRSTARHDPDSHALLVEHRPRDRGDPDAAWPTPPVPWCYPCTATSTSARCCAGPRGTPSSTSTATRPARPHSAPRTPRRRWMSPACWSAWRTSSHVARHAAAHLSGPEAAALDWTALAWTGHAQGVFLTATGAPSATGRTCSTRPWCRRTPGSRSAGRSSTPIRARPPGVALRPRRVAAPPAGGHLMDAHLFLADLEEKPARLAGLAQRLRDEDPWAAIGEVEAGVLLLGMGSSHYANQVAAARLRSRGVPAVAELAASDLLPGRPAGHAGRRGVRLRRLAPRPSTPYDGSVRPAREHGSWGSPTWSRQARPTRWASSATSRSTWPRVRSAGEWRAGRSSTRWPCCWRWRATGSDSLDQRKHRLDQRCSERAAAASAHLLDTRADWLPAVSTAALGPDGTHVVAPARRISSALQSALMLREGPRLPAVGCETADWSHVDVYLTKTTDYRLVLLAGSRWEPELLDWVRAARQHPRGRRRRDARRRGHRALPPRRRGRRTPAHRDPGRRAGRSRGLAQPA